MRRRDLGFATSLDVGLTNYDRNDKRLSGISTTARRTCLVQQLVDSHRRVQFVRTIGQRPVSILRAQPASPMFDPIRAAYLHGIGGNTDEACWLVFLATHFGKHRIDKWQLARDIYGNLNYSTTWTWAKTSANPNAFKAWLQVSQSALKSSTISRRFGNHRKYESLKANTANGTAAVVTSYVDWVCAHTDHSRLINQASASQGHDPKKTFAFLYSSMSDVVRFGRTSKFDYLSFLGKLRLANITADKAYLANSTGPLKGARLLFGGSTSSPITPMQLEKDLSVLEPKLAVGMQVIEDALCNWQKSPSRFIRFRG